MSLQLVEVKLFFNSLHLPVMELKTVCSLRASLRKSRVNNTWHLSILSSSFLTPIFLYSCLFFICVPLTSRLQWHNWMPPMGQWSIAWWALLHLLAILINVCITLSLSAPTFQAEGSGWPPIKLPLSWNIYSLMSDIANWCTFVFLPNWTWCLLNGSNFTQWLCW